MCFRTTSHQLISNECSMSLSRRSLSNDENLFSICILYFRRTLNLDGASKECHRLWSAWAAYFCIENDGLNECLKVFERLWTEWCESWIAKKKIKWLIIWMLRAPEAPLQLYIDFSREKTHWFILIFIISQNFESICERKKLTSYRISLLIHFTSKNRFKPIKYPITVIRY